MTDEQIKAIEQEVYRLNNHDSHLDIAAFAGELGVECPICKTCERIWAILHPEDSE